MKLTPGAILDLVGEISNILKVHGVFNVDGEVVTPVSAQGLSKSIAAIFTLLESKGVVVAGNVDKIVQLIPVILQLADVK